MSQCTEEAWSVNPVLLTVKVIVPAVFVDRHVVDRERRHRVVVRDRAHALGVRDGRRLPGFRSTVKFSVNSYTVSLTTFNVMVCVVSPQP